MRASVVVLYVSAPPQASLGVPWGFNGRSLGVPWGFNGRSLGVPWAFPGRSLGVPWASPWAFPGSLGLPWASLRRPLGRPLGLMGLFEIQKSLGCDSKKEKLLRTKLKKNQANKIHTKQNRTSHFSLVL